MIALFQETSRRLKYSLVPTVAAVDGMALGGGCEFVMHAQRVVASLESYIGLVEVGVGLLPAGGGLKELAARAAAWSKGGDAFPELQRAFRQVAMGEVSKSAEHAREMGYLKPDDLSRAAERQASAIVLNAMRYRSGNYTIEFTSNFPDEIIALQLGTERLILDGMARIDFWSLITRGISRLDRVLEQAPGSDARSYALELNEEESHVFNLVSEPATVEEICARSYLPNFVSCRTVWGLLTVNLLQDAERAVVVETRAAEESEYELAAMVERYNEAFQAIFAIVLQKIGDHVYDFIDRVVLHVSPETLPYLSGMNLVNEGRIDFDQLLNNLIASGSENQPTIVHTVLNELLYGWILEIKAEFGGTSLERDIVTLVNRLKR